MSWRGPPLDEHGFFQVKSSLSSTTRPVRGVADMASSLRIGQVVKGVRDVYVVAQKLHDQVWSASTTAHKQVVLKCGPEIRLQREKEILQQFVGDSCIRNFIDHGKEPPFLVLEHLEFDALRASSEARISRQDIKFIARSVLSALGSLYMRKG